MPNPKFLYWGYIEGVKAGFEPVAPYRAHDTDTGYDLTCTERVVIQPGAYADVHCSIAVKLPPNTWALLTGRSSTFRRHGLLVIPGVIDNGYRGELFSALYNVRSVPFEVQPGMRLTQMILIPMVTPAVQYTESLGRTERGTAGFGSTGI